MLKKLICAVLIIACTGCVLSGCNANIIEPVDSLMVPPSFYEGYEELVEAFRGAVGNETVFCPPASGDYRSAIVFGDIDGDKSDEALAFYMQEESQGTVRMHFLDVINGKWASVADFAGYGTGVESIEFVDMNNSGVSELLVTWSLYSGSANKVLSLYKNTAPSGTAVLRELSNFNFSVMQTVDIDSDGKKEIVYIGQNTVAGITTRSARALKLKDDSIIVTGEAKLDSNVSRYVSIKTEKVSGDMPMRIYADALKGESQMITEVLYWSEEFSDLIDPFLDPETLANTVTQRNEPIPSRDINNDGTIDIPTQSSLISLSRSNEVGDITREEMTQWINLTENGVETVFYSYVNLEENYMVEISEETSGSTLVRNAKSQNCWVFFEKDAQNNDSELFSLISVPVENAGDEKYSLYTVLMENDKRVLFGYIGQKGREKGIDEVLLSERVSEFVV